MPGLLRSGQSISRANYDVKVDVAVRLAFFDRGVMQRNVVRSSGLL